jgi:hypothetical protein
MITLEGCIEAATAMGIGVLFIAAAETFTNALGKEIRKSVRTKNEARVKESARVWEAEIQKALESAKMSQDAPARKDAVAHSPTPSLGKLAR